MNIIIHKGQVGNIYEIRGQKVMLDFDLAHLYGVETRSLNQAVTRNSERFPTDFAFILTKEELLNLKSQIVISSWGGRRSLPLAFTEHGILMLSSVLRSEQAIMVNIHIMRAFITLRESLAGYAELYSKLEAMEQKYDEQFGVVFDAIRNMLLEDQTNSKKKIGYRLNDRGTSYTPDQRQT